MITGRLLARNTALNLVGLVLPLFVAVIAAPVLVHALGADRFGILTLAWALIGYFALLDFGLGRALTQSASQALGAGEEQRLRDLSVFSIATMFTLGIVGGAVVAVLTPWLAYSVLEMEPTLRPEAATSFYLLAASLPFVLATIGFRALLEAHQHFGLATALRLPYAIFNFVGPVLVLPVSHSLVPIVAVLVAGRLVMFGAHVVACLRRYPWLMRGTPLSGLGTLGPLIRDGGWMMISNVVSPLMVYLDRFVIGALISMTAVTFYAMPFELTSKLLFLPAAAIGVFFPAFAAMYAQNRDYTVQMFDRANRMVLIGVFPAGLIFVAFAREILHVWVGPEFAVGSATVMQLLAIGMLINGLAQVPVAFLQATRRADLTAKTHLMEFPLYAVMIVVLGRSMGVTGVALAWTLRVSIDTIALSWLCRRQMVELTPGIDRILVWLGGATVALVTTMLPTGLLPRVLIAGTALTIFLAIAWKLLLLPRERDFAAAALPWDPRPVQFETSGGD